MPTTDRQTSLVVRRGGAQVAIPSIISDSGRRAKKRFAEFFAAQISNASTRRAYTSATRRFLGWCEEQGLGLQNLEPVAAAAYIEGMKGELSTPTVKQHLSALRALFDWLVTGHVVEFNPFAPVKTPRYAPKTGKTPVLYEDDARALLESIDTSTVVGLRDRAMIGTMIYTFARVGAVVRLEVQHYRTVKREATLALHEKGGKWQRVPCHHKLADLLDAYLEVAGLKKGAVPLFQSVRGRSVVLTGRAMTQGAALAMVKRRAVAAGYPGDICNHTFRATGITNYLAQEGSLEMAASIAGHASTQTTQLYNRNRERISRQEIERIQI